jgi:hypothetical protein
MVMPARVSFEQIAAGVSVPKLAHCSAFAGRRSSWPCAAAAGRGFVMSAFGGKAEIFCSIRALPLWTQSGHRRAGSRKRPTILPYGMNFFRCSESGWNA